MFVVQFYNLRLAWTIRFSFDTLLILLKQTIIIYYQERGNKMALSQIMSKIQSVKNLVSQFPHWLLMNKVQISLTFKL